MYDCDTQTGELTLLRRSPVLPLPGGAEYDPGRLRAAPASGRPPPDGTRVPISLVCRAGTAAATARHRSCCTATAPTRSSIDPCFSIPRLSLLDRGVVFAIAHVRGGGELGRRWYDDGKLLSKKNTFTDFVACARAPGQCGLDVSRTGWSRAAARRAAC